LRISVITGNRAEWGLLKPLVEKMKKDSFFDISVIATGSHLSPYHGNTINEIEDAVKVEILLESDSNVGMCKSFGLAAMSMTDAYQLTQPEMIMVLGDRYEVFAATISAYMMGIKIAHLHGGEQSGNVDDAFRDCITRMADIHFVATKKAEQRIIKTYDNPWQIYQVGALGCEGLMKKWPKIWDNSLLIIFHPTTPIDEGIGNLLFALRKRQENKIFILANVDAGGAEINRHIIDFCVRNSHCEYYQHFERSVFLRWLGNVKAIIGNSSAGIIEAPAVGTPTLDIGSRQKNREKAPTILTCSNSVDDIEKGIDHVCQDSFREYAGMTNVTFPYGHGQVCQKIIDILKKEK